MEMINIGCQGCNNSCPLHVTVEGQKVIEVSGNCCHRGIISAKTQIEEKRTQPSNDFTGQKKIYCTGCSNRCELEVTVENGRVTGLSGEGCRRGIISARKQLERPDSSISQ